MSLEFALTLPAFFLAVVALLQATGLVRDLIVVQSAAREGARAAAVTRGDDHVRAIVDSALEGRPATVTVSPRARRPGDLVTVEVTVASRMPLGPATVTARAHARVEAVVGAP